MKFIHVEENYHPQAILKAPKKHRGPSYPSRSSHHKEAEYSEFKITYYKYVANAVVHRQMSSTYYEINRFISA